MKKTWKKWTTKWGQNGENSKKLKITYFPSIMFWFFTSSFFFPHNVVSTATHRRTRLLETRMIIFWKMQTKCDLWKHSFTFCCILNAGRYHKMGPKWRNLEKNAGRYPKMKWRKLQKTENQVFSIDNFLIFHVELFVSTQCRQYGNSSTNSAFRNSKDYFLENANEMWFAKTFFYPLYHFECRPLQQNGAKKEKTRKKCRPLHRYTKWGQNKARIFDR